MQLCQSGWSDMHRRGKTENDIENNRTYEQLQDFSSVELNGKLCEVFVGVPQTGEDLFNRTLERWGLKGLKTYIFCLFLTNNQ